MRAKQKTTRETEGEVEGFVIYKARACGGIAFKFTSPGRRSVPDRHVRLPEGVEFYIECKAQGKKVTELQETEHARLRKLGARVYVCDTRAAVQQVFAQEFPVLAGVLPL